MYEVAVIDDETVSLENTAQLVKTLLKEHPCRIHCFSGMEQLDFFEETALQIVVLDIELGGPENGVQVARRLRQRSPGCQIIFLTNYSEYISEVYEVPHLYFMMKQTAHQYLPKALDMALECLANQEKHIFWLQQGLLKKRLQQQEIMMFERCQRVTLVHTAQDVYRISTSISKIEPLVEAERFVRCHQSFLVNMGCVVQHTQESFMLMNGATVPISRQYQRVTKEKFLQYIAQCVQI